MTLDSCRRSWLDRTGADVAELVDALDLGSSAARRGGSIPLIRTNNCLKKRRDARRTMKKNQAWEALKMSGKNAQAASGLGEAIAELEAKVDAIATAVMGTEEFAKTANMASALQLKMQNGMAGHMSRQLALFNMPSREDIAALGERVMVMDERLVRIEEMLQRLSPAGAGATSGPPRTKRPAAAPTAAKTATRNASKKSAS